MPTSSKISVLNAPDSSHTFSRRELAQKLISGLAAGLASPLSFSFHPIRRYLLNAALLDSADIHLLANGKPLLLSKQQLAALDLLSEAIITGARKSQAASFIDVLLSADSQEVQQAFLASLNAFETASQNKFHATLASLSAAQLHDLLVDLSAATAPDHHHFNNLKDWIAGAYYSSEIGMRELGWTPDRVFSQFPSCPHPEGHV
jgi:hypothetical protein